jgi:pyridoxal 5'-phosphate synthase pdxT subunit
MARVGVLALQGAFARHAEVIAASGHAVSLVRAIDDFQRLDGLVLPGGESTVQLKLLVRLGLCDAMRRLIGRGCPVLATCAGLILVASRVIRPTQESFGFVDVRIARNDWGRQIDSFEATSDEGRPLVFIRAPRIVDAGPRVEVLDRLRGEPILVRQGSVTGATFHPELTADPGVHRMVFGDG